MNRGLRAAISVWIGVQPFSLICYAASWLHWTSHPVYVIATAVAMWIVTATVAWVWIGRALS